MNTNRDPARKIGIAIPARVLRVVDAAARERGETRSGFIVRVLREATARARDREITRRLDALFSDPAIAADQVETAEELLDGHDWDEWNP